MVTILLFRKWNITKKQRKNDLRLLMVYNKQMHHLDYILPASGTTYLTN